MSTQPDIQVFVDLQEGFDGEDLLIRAEGLDPIRLAGLRTRLQTGLAHALSLRLPRAAGGATLTIELPALGLSQAVRLPDAPTAWLGVSLSRQRDALQLRLQDSPFGYV